MFTSHTTGGVEAQVADIIAGKMDYAFGNAVNDISTANNIVKNNSDIEMVIVPSSYQRQFAFNLVGSSDDKYNEDMQKAEVRQAFNLIIDKEAIAGIYSGQATALTTWVNPQSQAYNSDIPLFKRDVETAKQMLTDAGFNFDRPIRILYYYNDQTTKDIMDIIVQNFAEAGVKVEPFLATGDLASIIYQVKNWDMMYFGNGLVDPIITYRTLVPGSVVDNYLGNNDARQELFGTLLSEYKASTDKQSMKEIGDKMQLEAYKAAYVVPVYGLNKIVLYNSKKVELDKSIFDFDQVLARNFKFDTWKLLQE
jgi:peptide/nickel transport system substrate-binding protein